MVLTEVTLPFPEHTLASGFVRFSRTTFDYAILNCAVTLHVAADSTEVVEFARVAVGETPALARRVPEVEHFLTGRYLDPDTIDAAAALAQRHVVTGSDGDLAALVEALLSVAVMLLRRSGPSEWLKPTPPPVTLYLSARPSPK